MSAIFGILQFNDTPVQNAHLQKMRDKLAPYGQEGADVFHAETAGLGCCLSKFGARSQDDIPVYTDETAGLTIVCDALLWNRAELLNALKLDDAATTQAILMAAYKAWGDDCPNHINGDFAFAVWDHKKQALFLARDHLGVRPLHYYFDGKTFAFATDIQALLCLPFVDKAFDEVRLYSIIKIIYHIQPEATAFRHIKKLHMAHTLQIGAGGPQITQYWSPGAGREIRLGTEAEYAKALYEVVYDAIKRRINGVSGKVAAELSGGLDSSVITILANQILKSQNKALAGSFSWSPPYSAVEKQPDDERERIAAVCKQEGLDCAFLPPKEAYEPRQSGESGTVAGGGIFQRELAALSLQGARFVLTGWGGDQGISHRANPKEFFFNRLWRPFFREARFAAKGSPVRFARFIYSNVVCRLFGRLNYFQMPQKSKDTFATREFETRMRGKCKRDILYFTVDPVKHIESGNIQTRTEKTALIDAEYQMQHLFPYLDHRVVDFAMSIPRELYYRNGLNRYVFRKAFEDILPPAFYGYNRKDDPAIIANVETKKALPPAAPNRQIEALDKALFSPYIDWEKLRKIADREPDNRLNPRAARAVSLCLDIQRTLMEINDA